LFLFVANFLFFSLSLLLSWQNVNAKRLTVFWRHYAPDAKVLSWMPRCVLLSLMLSESRETASMTWLACGHSSLCEDRALLAPWFPLTRYPMAAIQRQRAVPSRVRSQSPV